jgi:hypothetical protein
VIDRSYRLEEIADAHRHAEAGHPWSRCGRDRLRCLQRRLCFGRARPQPSQTTVKATLYRHVYAITRPPVLSETFVFKCPGAGL